MEIAVANLKGGVGKTTTAIYLAEVTARKFGRCGLVDLDSQKSARRWFEAAAGQLTLEFLDNGGRGGGSVIYDTPPGDASVVELAMTRSDVVIVPARPSILDLDRLAPTLELVRLTGKPAAILLTQVRQGTKALAEARAALDEQELPVLNSMITLRESIAGSAWTQLDKKGLEMYTSVLDEIMGALGVSK